MDRLDKKCYAPNPSDYKKNEFSFLVRIILILFRKKVKLIKFD